SVVEARNSAESEIQSSKELRSKLQDEAVRLDNRIVTLESQYKDDQQARRTKLTAREVDVKLEEDRIRQDELALEERQLDRRTKVLEDFKVMRASIDEGT